MVQDEDPLSIQAAGNTDFVLEESSVFHLALAFDHTVNNNHIKSVNVYAASI